MVVMATYINSLFSLMRKHYAENWLKYLGVLLATFAVPLLFAYLSDEAYVVVALGAFVWRLALVYVVYLTTKELRSRYKHIMATTLPVSAAERYGFIMANTIVVSLVIYFVCYLFSIHIAKQMLPISEETAWMLNGGIWFTNLASIVGVFNTQAIMLAINLVPSRRLVVNYLVAFALFLAYHFLFLESLDVTIRGGFTFWTNIVVTLLLWVGCYMLVRKYCYKG